MMIMAHLFVRLAQRLHSRLHGQRRDLNRRVRRTP
jgi:hypothetical protein